MLHQNTQHLTVNAKLRTINSFQAEDCTLSIFLGNQDNHHVIVIAIETATLLFYHKYANVYSVKRVLNLWDSLENPVTLSVISIKSSDEISENILALTVDYDFALEFGFINTNAETCLDTMLDIYNEYSPQIGEYIERFKDYSTHRHL